jgi:hypothetical protein
MIWEVKGGHMVSRRGFLGLCSLLIAGRTAGAEQQNQYQPDPSTFEAGDLLWPKPPGKVVPYRSGTQADLREERNHWITEKEIFISEAPAKAPHLAPQEIEKLRELTFDQFYEIYAADRNPSGAGTFGLPDGVYVGHVGLIDLEGGTPWVVEALWGSGVVRMTYDEWLQGRSNELVWHGRLRGYDTADRGKTVAEAKNHLGKPYDFWNFDLDDSSVFYCSKLAWMSIFRSLGASIDGDRDPKRSFWFSPKQLMNCEGVSVLFSPGDYGIR